MSIIGVVYKSGMALPETVDEVKNVINCSENVTISRFLDLPTAYIAMVQEYENRGIVNKMLLPAPTLEDLAAVRFFSTESFTDIMERNRFKNRWFTLWSIDSYGIFNNIELLVDAYFTPGADFILTEVVSQSEAVNDIFTKYARVTFPVWQYCGGVPVPMLGNQFTYNVLVRVPYRQYLATNCVIPELLTGMLPSNIINNNIEKIAIAGIVKNEKEIGVNEK